MLQQGFKKSGINATIQPLPAAQWFDRLYTKRNHDGIAVNAGSLPFPWALIANYMMKATLLKNPPKYPKGAIPALEAAYNLAFSSANEAQYSAALKTIQRLMLRPARVPHDDGHQPEHRAAEPPGRRLDRVRRSALRRCVLRLGARERPIASDTMRRRGSTRLPAAPCDALPDADRLADRRAARDLGDHVRDLRRALPGDAAEIRVGKRDDLTSEERNRLVAPMRKELGLDKPLPVQYAIWLGKVAQGDFGVQEGGGSVGKAVLTRIVPSLELTIIDAPRLACRRPRCSPSRRVRRGKRVVGKGCRPAPDGRVRRSRSSGSRSCS